MKTALILVFFYPLLMLSQGDTIIEYKDKGNIKSIEYSCQQGYFKNGTGELKSYHYWMSCSDGVIQVFDESGYKITECRNYSNCHWNGFDADSCRTIEYFDYSNGFLRHTTAYRIINESDTLEHLETFSFMNHDGIQTDSVFLNGNILEKTTILFFDSLKNILYIHDYLADSSFESHFTLWYDDAGRVVKEHYQTLGDEKYSPYESSTYFKFTGNTRTEEVFFKDTLAGGSFSEYNNQGLVIKEKYLTVPENEPEKPEIRTYSYVYDSQGNWIEKWIYQGNELIVIERRNIIYYTE